jgi:transcriptional regulator with XRE-family HTH domain
MKSMKILRIEQGLTLANLSSTTGIAMERLYDIENRLHIPQPKERYAIRKALDAMDLEFILDPAVAVKNRIAMREKLKELGLGGRVVFQSKGGAYAGEKGS